MIEKFFFATMLISATAFANTVLTCESQTQPGIEAVVFRGPDLKPVYAGLVKSTGISPIELLRQGRIGHGQPWVASPYGSQHFSINAQDQRLLYVKGYALPFKCKDDLFANIFPL